MAAVVALSQEFNNRIGEKATNELAGWLNTMNSNLHNEIKELNERNVALFRAEMKAGLAEVDVKLSSFEVKLASIEIKWSKFETRLLWTMMTFWTVSLLSMLGTFVALKQ